MSTQKKPSETVQLLKQIEENTRRTADYVKQFLQLAFVAIVVVAAIVFVAIFRG